MVTRDVEDFDSDEFFRNDFGGGEEEEVGTGLDRSGETYLTGSQRLKRSALRWFGVSSH